MKKEYSKPILAVEYYSLTQAVASCSIKIFNDPSKTEQERVWLDPDSTREMKNMARRGGFIQTCLFFVTLDTETSDGSCYHTNSNGAFSS
jgi:hypothetical protein